MLFGLLMVGGATSVYWWVSRYDALILKQCEAYDLDFYLVKSLIWEESGFNPLARGQDGEFGLMQVMPYVGREFWAKAKGLDSDLYDPNLLLTPEHNIEVGCWYLRDSLDLYRERPDPLPYAIARYNAGHSRVSRWMKNGIAESNSTDFVQSIDFPETRAYVQRIIKRSERRSAIYLW